MSRYTHIIWDWNGTLLDDVGLCLHVMNGMLRRRTMPEISLERYREVFDFPVVGYYQALGFDVSDRRFESLALEYCTEYDARVDECRLHAGVEDALDALSKAVPMHSVLSSCEQRALAGALGHFGLTNRFQEVIGQSNQYAAGKLEAGKSLLRRSGVGASATLLVGDTLHDYEVACSLGVDCVLLANGHQSKERLEAAHHTIADSLDMVASFASQRC